MSWADVFPQAPSLLLSLRPRAIAHDPVYGPFFTTLLRAAQARTAMRGVTALEAARGADEIVVASARGGDPVMVLVGVPANLDAERMSDDQDRPLFHVHAERAQVLELERTGSGEGALFVLPSRTWVVVSSEARHAARAAFASPRGSRVPELDPDALAVVRVEAPLSRRRELLGPWHDGLECVVATVPRGPARRVEGSLRYRDEAAARSAEPHVRRLLGALAGASPRDTGTEAMLAWLARATVGREERAITLAAALPSELLDKLARTAPTELAR